MRFIAIWLMLTLGSVCAENHPESIDLAVVSKLCHQAYFSDGDKDHQAHSRYQSCLEEYQNHDFLSALNDMLNQNVLDINQQHQEDLGLSVWNRMDVYASYEEIGRDFLHNDLSMQEFLFGSDIHHRSLIGQWLDTCKHTPNLHSFYTCAPETQLVIQRLFAEGERMFPTEKAKAVRTLDRSWLTYLLSKGLNIDVVHQGTTPLMRLTQSYVPDQPNRLDDIRMFVDLGASPLTYNQQGLSSLDYVKYVEQLEALDDPTIWVKPTVHVHTMIQEGNESVLSYYLDKGLCATQPIAHPQFLQELIGRFQGWINKVEPFKEFSVSLGSFQGYPLHASPIEYAEFLKDAGRVPGPDNNKIVDLFYEKGRCVAHLRGPSHLE